MNSLKFQRDALITKIFNEAKKDKNILFLSADFGAPSLDKFREELPEQFIHTGISEQNTKFFNQRKLILPYVHCHTCMV